MERFLTSAMNFIAVVFECSSLEVGMAMDKRREADRSLHMPGRSILLGVPEEELLEVSKYSDALRLCPFNVGVPYIKENPLTAMYI